MAVTNVVPGKRYVGQTIPRHCDKLQYAEQDCNQRDFPLRTQDNSNTYDILCFILSDDDYVILSE